MRSLQRISPWANIFVPVRPISLFSTMTRSRPQLQPSRAGMRPPSTLVSNRSFHPTTSVFAPRRRDFFTSNVRFSKSPDDGTIEIEPEKPAAPSPAPPKRKVRGKNSLRRVALIAQQPSGSKMQEPPRARQGDYDPPTEVMSAICLAEGFHMAAVPPLLRQHGYIIDPDNTGFDIQEVVHARPTNASASGDVFVFPSGTLVTWSHPISELTNLLAKGHAAEDLHEPARRETEDLEYVSDPSKDTSTIVKDDVVVLGTRREDLYEDRLDTTLAKVAFSSGLARSTKLAVLESDLARYFLETKNIPSILSQGSRLPFSRSFIAQKTGALLSLSARLNNYSELTESLPDIFWDSRSELGLEGYYEQVGKALDVNVRIRTLNQRLGYAQEIATVLREMSSERHGTRLEMIIILLIAVEVVFELRREWKEYYASKERDEKLVAH